MLWHITRKKNHVINSYHLVAGWRGKTLLELFKWCFKILNLFNIWRVFSWRDGLKIIIVNMSKIWNVVFQNLRAPCEKPKHGPSRDFLWRMRSKSLHRLSKQPIKFLLLFAFFKDGIRRFVFYLFFSGKNNNGSNSRVKMRDGR